MVRWLYSGSVVDGWVVCLVSWPVVIVVFAWGLKGNCWICDPIGYICNISYLVYLWVSGSIFLLGGKCLFELFAFDFEAYFWEGSCLSMVLVV